LIWLIGCKGMLGTEISLLFEKSGISFISTDREVDITDLNALDNFAKDKGIKWIINCAAYTAVDKAEDDVDICRSLNTFGAANIAACAKKIGATLIHLSTDYVFDGKGIISNETSSLRPYIEDDKTNPTGVYGLTKRDGEITVMENNPNFYIIRTAWLYGKYGKNFVATMINLMNDKDEIKVVDDQRGSPTWAFDLASLILLLINNVDSSKKIPYGIYHYTNEGNISWYDFAKEIYAQGKNMGLIKKNCSIVPITSDAFLAKVKRPAYSVLDKDKIKTALKISIPSWDESLKEFLKCLEH